MKKEKRFIRYSIQAIIDIDAEDVDAFAQVFDVLENIREFGTADIVDVQVIKKQE